jgi:hypothetical protein
MGVLRSKFDRGGKIAIATVPHNVFAENRHQSLRRSPSSVQGKRLAGRNIRRFQLNNIAHWHALRSN